MSVTRNSQYSNSGGRQQERHNIPEASDINSLWRSHRRYARSFKENKRKQTFYKLARVAAIGFFAYDIFLTYQGVMGHTGSQGFAVFCASFVGVLQWVVSESILSRSLDNLLSPDFNADGRVSAAEAGRLAVYWLSVLIAYGFDFLTNLAAIDAEALGTLPFAAFADNPTVPVWAAWVITLIVCAVLCFSDEMILSFADNRLADLEEELPALKERAAVVTAKLQAAGAFSVAYVARAEEAGRKRGESEPI